MTKRSERRSPKMREVEKRFSRDLLTMLPEMLTEHGLTGAADMLDLSKATLAHWLLKLDIVVHRVALRPGQILKIVDVETGKETEIESS